MYSVNPDTSLSQVRAVSKLVPFLPSSKFPLKYTTKIRIRQPTPQEVSQFPNIKIQSGLESSKFDTN